MVLMKTQRKRELILIEKKGFFFPLYSNRNKDYTLWVGLF